MKASPLSSRSLPVALLAIAAAIAPVAFAQSPTLDSEQTAFLTLINNYRAQNGAGALQVSVALQNSSQWMSTDLATKNYFSHTDSLGRSPGTRLAAFGYSYYPWGENIAAGNSTAQNTLNQWITACDADASGNCTYAHRRNMLNPSFKVIGIGRAYNASAAYRWYWTTDFGGVVDQVLNPANSAPAISSFTAAPNTINSGQTSTLSWNVSNATSVNIDNGIGSVPIAASRAVTPGQTTTYTLTATNAGGTTTARVTVTVNAVYDSQAPTTPVIVSAVAKSSSEVDLGWSASADNIGIAGYQIVRNGTVVKTVAGNVLTYADTTVQGGIYYSYSVKAFDAAGNYSLSSSAVFVATPTSTVSLATKSVSPNTGGGSVQAFDFTFTDPLGYQSISYVEIDISQTLTASRACLIYFAPAWNQVYLANDAGNSWLGPLVLGTQSSLQNGQCGISGSTSFYSGSGTNLSLRLAMSFPASYAGLKNIYSYVQDKGSANSGWSTPGSWNVR